MWTLWMLYSNICSSLQEGWGLLSYDGDAGLVSLMYPVDLEYLIETEDLIYLNGGCRLEIYMDGTCRLRTLLLDSFMHGLCGLGQFERLVKRSSRYSTSRKWWCWVSYCKISWIWWSGSSRLRWQVKTIKYCSCRCISIFCSIHLHRSRQCVGRKINKVVMIGGDNTT